MSENLICLLYQLIHFGCIGCIYSKPVVHVFDVSHSLVNVTRSSLKILRKDKGIFITGSVKTFDQICFFKYSHGLLFAHVHFWFNSKFIEEKPHRRLFLQPKSLSYVGHLEMFMSECIRETMWLSKTLL